MTDYTVLAQQGPRSGRFLEPNMPAKPDLPLVPVGLIGFHQLSRLVRLIAGFLCQRYLAQADFVQLAGNRRSRGCGSRFVSNIYAEMLASGLSPPLNPCATKRISSHMTVKFTQN